MNLMFSTPLAAHISAALILALVIVLTTIRFEVIKAKVAMLTDSHIEANKRSDEVIESLNQFKQDMGAGLRFSEHAELNRIIHLLHPLSERGAA